MKRVISILMGQAALGLSALAAVPLRWTVETTRAQPATFEAYQGETLAFEAALQSAGKPLELSGIAALYWQTNGMGSAYWEATAAVNSNRLSAVFTPEMDVGAKVYNCFIGIPGTVYHAAFQLRLRPSPGALPNVLPLPVPVIDFAKVRVLNPPWSGGGGVDTNAVERIANRAVETNAVTVATTNRVSELEKSTNNLTTAVSGKLDGPTVAPSTDASASGKAADAKATGDALTNRYTRAETDAKLAGKADVYEANGVLRLDENIRFFGNEQDDMPTIDLNGKWWNADLNVLRSVYAHDVIIGDARISASALANFVYGELLDTVSDKANRPSSYTSGNLAALDVDGNLADSGIATNDVATKAYADGKGLVAGSMSEWEAVTTDPSYVVKSISATIADGEAYVEFAIVVAGSDATMNTQGVVSDDLTRITPTDQYVLNYVTEFTRYVTYYQQYDASAIKVPAYESLDKFASKSMISATDPTFSNEVATVARTVTPPPSPTLRLYDEVRQCYWIGKMVNGVMQWEVE